MPTSLWRLTVRDEFCAGHALRHYQGKCEALHGHNFAVEVTVQGTELTADTELLLDFTELKTHLKAVLSDLDHCVLNTTAPFDVYNPSFENLARHIYRRMSLALSDSPVRMYCVTVGEKASQSASYMEIEYTDARGA